MTSPESTRINTPETTADLEQQALQLAESLKNFEPGRLPYPLFMEIARLAVLGTVEMVPLRTTPEGKTEVLLTQRPKGDVWAGQWHVPGTVMLPTDTVKNGSDYDDAFERIFAKEGELQNGLRLVGEPTYVSTERRKTARGDELSVIHYAEVAGEPSVGQFFDVDQLEHTVPAPGMIEHQMEFVQEAAEAFRARNN